MQQQANKHKTEREFKLGDFVYVKLQTYRQKSLVSRSCHKLSAKYFGPYPIVDRIGEVAYKLQLPEGGRVIMFFMFPQLKKHIGKAPALFKLPLLGSNRVVAREPIAVILRMPTRSAFTTFNKNSQIFFPENKDALVEGLML